MGTFVVKRRMNGITTSSKIFSKTFEEKMLRRKDVDYKQCFSTLVDIYNFSIYFKLAYRTASVVWQFSVS